MTRVASALVIGGGIAGPATAMALRRAGIEAVVCEADPAPRDGGAMLTVATNGIDALGALGARDRVLAAGFPTPRITLRNAAGRRLGETRTGTSPPSRTLQRAALAAALRDEALERGVAIAAGMRLTAVEEGGDGVRATFAGGEVLAADVLIGCDGVRSTVRRLIDSAAPAPAYAGLLNAWGIAHGVDTGVPAGGYEMVFGARAFFGHVPAPEGEVWWFANVPARREPARTEPARDPRALLEGLFAGDAGPAAALVAATPVIPAPLPIHAMPSLPRWHRGRMLVLGDAAHAPSPSSGQGASLALEDAVVLALCLREEPGHAAAFARFEALRRPRVERIIRRAERINDSKAPGPIGRRVRDAVLPLALRLAAAGRAERELYDHHLEWPEAPAVR